MAERKSMNTTVQTLGRVAIIGGTMLVSLANVYLLRGVGEVPEADKALAYLRVYQLALVIPLVSVLGVVLGLALGWRDARRLVARGFARSEARGMLNPHGDRPPVNWWIMGGGLAFALVSLGVGIGEVAGGKKIVFGASMAIVLFLMWRITSELEPEAATCWWAPRCWCSCSAPCRGRAPGRERKRHKRPLSEVPPPDAPERQVLDQGAEAQRPVYGNRRRVGGRCGKRLMRRRGEYVERTFAHVYDTGGLRRTHLRGHQNIMKRLIVHAGAFNLGLLMRHAIGRGTPRGLQGRRRPCFVLWLILYTLLAALGTTLARCIGVQRSLSRSGISSFSLAAKCSPQ